MSDAQQFKGWKKAKRSAATGNCVEVGASATHVGVRDTKDRDGGTLAFTPAAWVSFLTDIRAGKFEHR